MSRGGTSGRQVEDSRGPQHWPPRPPPLPRRAVHWRAGARPVSTGRPRRSTVCHCWPWRSAVQCHARGVAEEVTPPPQPVQVPASQGRAPRPGPGLVLGLERPYRTPREFAGIRGSAEEQQRGRPPGAELRRRRRRTRRPSHAIQAVCSLSTMRPHRLPQDLRLTLRQRPAGTAGLRLRAFRERDRGRGLQGCGRTGGR